MTRKNIGWKAVCTVKKAISKCYCGNTLCQPMLKCKTTLVLAKLEILGQVVTPKSESELYNKLRTDCAKVLGLYSFANPRTKLKAIRAVSHQYKNFTYVVGQTVIPTQQLNLDPLKTCGTGIHYFKTIKEVKAFCDSMGWH